MTTNYPTGYDVFASNGANLSSTPTHSSMHENMIDAMEAVQAELGLNPSGSYATVAARLAAPIVEADIDNGAVTSAKIADGTIVNGDINASAAIAYSKLSLAGSITSNDIADGTIVNGDISASAAIVYSKLAAVPKVRLRRAANQSQGAGEFALSWDTEDADTHGFWSSGTTITVPAGLGGMYTVSGRWTSGAGISGAGYSYVYINSATKYTHYVPSGNDNGAFHFTGLLNDGATVVVQVQNPSGTVNFLGNLEMVRIGG